MQKKVVKILTALTFVIVFIPSARNLRQPTKSATITPQCNGCTITVSGQKLEIAGVTWTVNSTILVRTIDGSTFSINDSISVFPDSNLNFNATATKAAGPATTNIRLSGTATLVDSNRPLVEGGTI